MSGFDFPIREKVEIHVTVHWEGSFRHFSHRLRSGIPLFRGWRCTLVLSWRGSRWCRAPRGGMPRDSIPKRFCLCRPTMFRTRMINPGGRFTRLCTSASGGKRQDNPAGVTGHDLCAHF